MDFIRFKVTYYSCADSCAHYAFFRTLQLAKQFVENKSADKKYYNFKIEKIKLK